MIVNAIVKLSRAGLAALALSAWQVAALAGDGLEDEPRGRALSWSVNIGATTDYVFRGITQSSEDPAVQGGADIGYGIFYAGVWASMIDFEAAGAAEVDFYAGIKPVWGPVTFDLGVIYYAYPGANDDGAELDYVELKLGASATFNQLTVGGAAFWSPEYTGEVGETWTLEGSVSYALPKVWVFDPSIGGLIGTTLFSDDSSLDYAYWNVGLTLVVDKLTLDFRYWDTDSDGADFCVDTSACDERFVFTAKVVLP
ncbi:MAG TPA: TorF family putative porin [Hyphomicrobiaceae bacterium]|nr:TorF family putative porin [Hyphomicrobiaceae bacterium]